MAFPAARYTNTSPTQHYSLSSLPHRLSPFQAKQLMECTEATLTVLFSSVQKLVVIVTYLPTHIVSLSHRAFSSSSNRSAVQQVVSLLVERQFTSPSLLPHSSLPLCSPVPPLPTKTAVSTREFREQVNLLFFSSGSCQQSTHSVQFM